MSSTANTIINIILLHEASMYRKQWGAARNFAELPVIDAQTIASVPLGERRYKKGAFVKIVSGGVPFLSEWSVDDIGKEEFGVLSRRPMVYMSNAHEALEKALWCYERGMVPLIGEKDPALAWVTAERYEADSLITDESALARLQPYIKKDYRLESISILGSAFTPDIRSHALLAKRVRLVLALPVTGAFAEAELTQEPQFTALSGCILEHGKTLVVSKEALLVTPIIRFDTGIKTKARGSAFALL